MKKTVGSLLLASLLVCGTSHAGNIFLTGHDDDFHGSTPGGAQLSSAVSFIKNGSALPVLTFDAGTELTNKLTSLGISYFNVNPRVAIATSVFDISKYSAFLVASDSTCGGCDNNPTDTANLIADSAAITAFLNAGGGIAAFAGGRNAGTYYGFLPETASGFGNPPSSGFTQTALGLSLGIGAVNGDATHNFFNEPGTTGVSSAYGVVERLTSTGQAVSLACVKCGVSDGKVISGTVPEPTTIALLGLGLFGFAASRRKSAK